jgi:hypothetical protein
MFSAKQVRLVKRTGVQFAYHNHTTEFDEVEGHRPFDYILNNTDKDMVKMELDLAWATKRSKILLSYLNFILGVIPCGM